LVGLFLDDSGVCLEGMMDLVWKVAEQFSSGGKTVEIQEFGNGNINDTYLVKVSGIDEGEFILQRINTHVFKNPKLIIRNLRTFTDHVDKRIMEVGGFSQRRWDVPHIRMTNLGGDYHVDSQDSFWRAITFVNDSRSYDTALSDQHAREAGYALGRFQSLISDLNPEMMYDTLEGFHIATQYLGKYDEIRIDDPRVLNTPEVRYCQSVIESHRSWVPVLECAKDQGILKNRIIHGDPKINNFMICNRTGEAISVIDLDTVKPGLVHYDIGDCLRSTCNPLGEETLDFENVRFDINLAKSILEGYVTVAKEFLTENDYTHMYDAICLIPFELGLRFFTDYLEGNVYFKVKHETSNLERALVQFKLTESIEDQELEIRSIITDLQQRFGDVRTH
jgi:hypothetical protein